MENENKTLIIKSLSERFIITSKFSSKKSGKTKLCKSYKNNSLKEPTFIKLKKTIQRNHCQNSS